MTKRYSATDYDASVVGFAPVNDPAVTILVVLNSPVGAHHGGDRAGRVQARGGAGAGVSGNAARRAVTAEMETAKNLRAAPRLDPAAAETDASKARFAEAVARGSEGAAPTAAFAGDDEVAVPPLGGETVRGVMEECSKVGLAPDLIGNGIALEQFPSAGTKCARQPSDGAIWRAGRERAGAGAGERKLTSSVKQKPDEGKTRGEAVDWKSGV